MKRSYFLISISLSPLLLSASSHSIMAASSAGYR
uniref:Uncharacterized protein n=1 Tax=Arundo donax TaxID=35708 RepID=A0A0A8ZXM3_ARUDO